MDKIKEALNKLNATIISGVDSGYHQEPEPYLCLDEELAIPILEELVDKKFPVILKTKCKNCVHFSLVEGGGRTGVCTMVQLPQWIDTKELDDYPPVDLNYGESCKAFQQKDYIDFFTAEHRWLSNFHECEIEYEGIIYPSTEHAYQAAKTLNQTIRKQISELPTAAKAKNIGRTIEVRKDWFSMSLKVMYDLNYQKFTKYPDLKLQLLATNPYELIERNWWKDTFWGICDGKGLNHLGKILMNVRNQIFKETYDGI